MIREHQGRMDRIFSHHTPSSLDVQFNFFENSINEIEQAMTYPGRPEDQLQQDEVRLRELTRVKTEIGHRIMGQLLLPPFEIEEVA